MHTENEMDVIDERALVYMAVLFLCSALAVFAGPRVPRPPLVLQRRQWRAPTGWKITWRRVAGIN